MDMNPQRRLKLVECLKIAEQAVKNDYLASGSGFARGSVGYKMFYNMLFRTIYIFLDPIFISNPSAILT